MPLIAGFTEIGETAEDTVRREVMEEVGLQIKSIRYYGNQPWGWTPTFFLDSLPSWTEQGRSTWTGRSSPRQAGTAERRLTWPQTAIA